MNEFLNKSVLLIDDDAVFRARLGRALENRHFEVSYASCAKSALEQANKRPSRYAIVDLKLESESGLAIVKSLKSRFDSMRIVMLTGYGSIATAVDALHHGASHYLTKPVDIEEIIAALDGEQREDAPIRAPSLDRVEWEHIQRVLHDCDGNISQAAKRLKMHRRSLQRKLNKLPPVN